MRDHLVDLYVNIINVIGQGSRNLANEVQRLTEILAQAESQMHQTSDFMQAQQKTIDEFQFPDNLKTLLHKMVALNILFVGNSGTGKTTLLKIMVREYFADVSNFDENVLYINSLTDNGINYYRNEVKTFCSISSKIANKKKIVVIDDMDLIVNDQCQQILRNYIDKYSNNVIFFTSCSNNQRVIDTIQSRLNIIRLVPINSHGIKEIYAKVIETEKIEIDDDATDFVITMCNSSVSMLLNYMEKFKLIGTDITLEMAQNICTNISFVLFTSYTTYLLNRQLKEAIKVMHNIHEKGYSVMDILDNYFLFVKTTNVLTESQKYSIIPYICKYITIFHNTHEHEIELYLFTNNLFGFLA